MITPAIKTKRTYQTSDMQSHDTISEAKSHECGLELRRRLIDAGFRDDTVRGISLFLAKNYKDVADVFDAIRRAHRS